MRRKPLPPDTRLDWRDLDMPVLGKSGAAIDHRKLHQLAKQRLYSDDPTYKTDPTYNLRRPHVRPHPR